MDKTTVIEMLELEAHKEGGFFRRTYEATQAVDDRHPTMSSIFYMLTDDSPIGHLHCNKSDIVHYWHAGNSLTYWLIDPNGQLSTVTLGPNLAEGEQLQLTVPGGVWKATELSRGEYGLLSEAVTPGFIYDDMTMASKTFLKESFPELYQQLERFCLHD